MFGFFNRWHNGVSMVALLLASGVGIGLANPAVAQQITSSGGAGGDYPSELDPNGNGGGGGGGYGSGGTGALTGQAGLENSGGAGAGPGGGSGGLEGGTASGPGSLGSSYTGGSGSPPTQNNSGSGGGGTGLILTGSVDTNNYSIVGGSGGGGTSYTAPGGGGGTGLLMRSGSTATVTGSAITGGSGGQGWFAYGGGGGAGAFLTSGGAINNVSGSITGGAGGIGVSGGSGGAGVLANGGRIDNSGAITGGAGGASTYSGDPSLKFEGGAGGSGVEVWGSSVNNAASGTITGGNGGDSTAPSGNPAIGGNGGHGVSFRSGAAGSLINDGIITGGNGGNANSGNHGVGGAGVIGSDLTIINSGTIIGGMSGDGTVQADAITFTGGTNKLTVTTAFADFYGAISINGGGTLTLDQSANNTEIFSDINGDGSIEKIGTATVLLSGINSYSGGTKITEGVLEVDGPQPLGTGTVTMNGGTLRVASCGCGGGVVGLLNDFAINTAGGTFDSGSGVLILIGNITDGNGPGTLTITGSGGPLPGFVIFAGNNTYSGPTHITADGVLLAATPTALSPNSAYIVDGILDMGGYDATFASLSGASTGQVGSSGFGNPVTLTIATASGTSTYNGIILDGGPDSVSVTKTGAGKQVLAGINTYTGKTTVDAGILSIDGSIASSSEVIVNSGGTLSGNGTVSTTTINAGGTLAPGNSIGTLTVQGDLTFKPGSTYQVEVSPSGADRVNVSGIATLNGAALSAIYEPGAYVTKRYTVLNAAGGVNGTFSGPVNTNLPTNFSTALNYDQNNAYLDLTLNYVPPGPTPPNFGNGLTVNQTNVGNALVNSFNTAGGIPLVLGALTPAGLTQASGELGTGIQQATYNVMDRFLNLMTDPYANGRTTMMLPMSYAPLPRGTQPLMITQQPRWSVWAAGYGGTQTTRGQTFTGSNTNTAGIYGFAAGADYRVSPETILGFALGGAGTNYHLANGLGSGSSNVFQAGLYGRQNFGAAYVAGSLAYGWQDVTTDRRVQFDQLRARFNAHMFSGRLETGYRFATPFGGLTPYAAGQFTNIALPAYREQAITGPGLFALSYGSKNVTAWRTELGLRGDKAIEMDNATLTLRGRLAWAHDYNPDRSVSASFLNLPASGFIVNGAAQARNAALVSAGAEMTWRNGWSVSASFEGSFSNRGNGYAGKGALRYQW